MVLLVWDVDVLDVVDADVLNVVCDFFSLIDSFAPHSEREIILTHGKFQLLAIEKLNIANNTTDNAINFLYILITCMPKK